MTGFPVSSPDPGRAVTLHRTDWRDSRRRRLANQLGDALSVPWRRYVRLLDSAQPDVVNTHNLPGIGTGIWEASRRLGVPVVHTVHDYHLLCPRVSLMRPNLTPCTPHPLLCGARTRSMLRWRSAVTDLVAGTKYALDAHAALFPASRHHVVPNPFDDVVATTRAPRPALRAIGYLGALHPNKGVLELLRAAPALARRGITLHVAGLGPLESEVRMSAQNGNLVYHGLVHGAAKAELIEECDLGIMPSVWAEPGGPPNSLLEWLGSGRPVLASARGCLSEAIERFDGCIAIDPTAESIEDCVNRLTQPAEWQAAITRALGGTFTNTEDSWLDRYSRLLRNAAAHGAREAAA